MIQIGAFAFVLIAFGGQTPPTGAPMPPSDPGCVADLDARIKSIRADAALTDTEQQARVDAAWNACRGQVRNVIAGRVSLTTDMAIRAAIEGDDDQARAAAEGLRTNARDPEHRVTLAIVGAGGQSE